MEMEIANMIWSGFLAGFRYVGIAAGFIIGSYVALLLAVWTFGLLKRLGERIGHREEWK